MRGVGRILGLLAGVVLLFYLVRSLPDWIRTIDRNTRRSLCLNLMGGYYQALSRFKEDAEKGGLEVVEPITPELLYERGWISERHWRLMKENSFEYEPLRGGLKWGRDQVLLRFWDEGWEVLLLGDGEILKVPPGE
ncbi:MAG: hypothetical protein NZM04_05985 [Methylacidiphilales bacterium]|nr:hypothetical protein [Candidatus Methylacidiphilales bacterium]MDW8349641.1 hypothetical protein [Verrucomicrobiae bacterium]